MASLSITPADIKIDYNYDQNMILNRQAKSDMDVGDLVYLGSDNKWALADADAAGTAVARGVVLTSSTQTGIGSPGTGYDADRWVSVLVFGILTGFTGLVEGSAIWTSTTPGDLEATKPAASGDFPYFVGWVIDDESIFINPQGFAPPVNS